MITSACECRRYSVTMAATGLRSSFMRASGGKEWRRPTSHKVSCLLRDLRASARNDFPFRAEARRSQRTTERIMRTLSCLFLGLAGSVALADTPDELIQQA